LLFGRNSLTADVLQV